jgi:transcriptional regulator with XRE-family HTH domain
MRLAHAFMDADATVFRNCCQRPIVTGFRLNTRMDKDPREMDFAERVKHFRELARLTQAQLAKAAELTPGAIGDIESGRSQSTPAIDLIAEALEVSTRMLRYGEDKSPPRHPPGSLSSIETKFVNTYRQLTGLSKIKLEGYMDGLPKVRSGKIADVDERPATRTKIARSRRSG